MMMVSMRRTRRPVTLGIGLVLLAVIGAAVFLINRSSVAAAPNPGPIRWGFPMGRQRLGVPRQAVLGGAQSSTMTPPDGRPFSNGPPCWRRRTGCESSSHPTRPNQQTITATDASLPPRAGETLYTFTGAKVPAQPTGTKDPIAHGIGLVLNRPASAKTHTFDGRAAAAARAGSPAPRYSLAST
jgi:hypothetical protein